MEQLLQQIEQYKQEIESTPVNGAESLEAYRIRFLGTKGILKQLFTEMRNVPGDRKKEFGQILNDFKQLAEGKFEEWKSQVDNTGTSGGSSIDLTLPGDELPIGSRHPISLMRNRIIDVFQRLGFAVAEGPEIEDDFHNFTALNLPEHHPARDMQDTFYIIEDAYFQYPDQGNGKRQTSFKDNLSGTRLPKRNYQCTFSLLFPPGGRIIYR
jgi:phenylalanyl-tRNA synthetase alpha chain